jgi:putative ABC transport system permease protein
MGSLTGTEGKATMFYLRIENPPRYQDEVRQALLATPGMGTYNVATAEEYLSSISPDRLPRLQHRPPSRYRYRRRGCRKLRGVR